ncbi:MAG: Uma2 family endonuclease, partial [Candidatus Eremiobacterota bacterium]
GGRYVELLDPLVTLEPLGLRFTLWEGTYAQCPGTWLRFRDAEGRLLATGSERAEEAEERAEEAEERASRMAQKLRELGIDPDA